MYLKSDPFDIGQCPPRKLASVLTYFCQPLAHYAFDLRFTVAGDLFKKLTDAIRVRVEKTDAGQEETADPKKGVPSCKIVLS